MSAYDTYGIRKTPLRFGRGIEMHKEQTKRSTRGIFTQVRATQRRKTLLLLSYIIDVLMLILGELLASKTQEQLRMQDEQGIVQKAIPCSCRLGPPFIRERGHQQWLTVHTRGGKLLQCYHT